MRPLEGIKVLDFSTLLPGPLATLMLAEAGAEVIKVEKPGGEDMRRFPPRVEGSSAPFAVLNAGKKSIEVDLKTEAGRRSLEPLLLKADVLVEQFRPGVMERLGLGYEAVRQANPRLVYCSITGYGQSGPRAGQAGHDLNYQAVGGLLSLSPTMPAALVADIAGGAMPAVMNILLALRQRDLTGEGAHLDIAMADAILTFAWFGIAEGAATGRYPGPAENMLAGGSPRYGLYETADGKCLAVGAIEQKFWEAFCTGVELPRELWDERKDPAATRAEVARRVRSRDAAAWHRILASLDCCATVLVPLEEAVQDPHFVGRDLLAYAAQANRRPLPLTALPIARAFRTPPEIPRQVPDSGEHTRAVLDPDYEG